MSIFSLNRVSLSGIRKVAAVFVVSIFLFSHAASAKGILFQKLSYAEALKQSKAKKKPVFIDAFTTWCGPCMYLSKNVFTLEDVGEYFNTNFICIKLDMDKEGKAIEEKYEVNAYPTLLFVDESGAMMHKVVGAMEGSELIEVGKIALNPSLNFKGAKDSYEKNKNSDEATLNYLKAMEQAGMDVTLVMDEFQNSHSGETLLGDAAWNIFSSFSSNAHSPSFTYVIKNKSLFDSKFGQPVVNEVMKKIYLAEAGTLYDKFSVTGDSADLNQFYSVIREFAAQDIAGSDTSVSLYTCVYYDAKKDYDAFAAQLIDHIKKFVANDDHYSIARFSSMLPGLTLNNSAPLIEAKKLMKEVVEKDPAFGYLHIYASINYALKDKKEASVYAQKAIDVAKQEGSDYSETSELLNNINSLK